MDVCRFKNTCLFMQDVDTYQLDCFLAKKKTKAKNKQTLYNLCLVPRETKLTVTQML